MAPKNNPHFARIVGEAFNALGVTQTAFHKDLGGPSDSTLRKITDLKPVGVSVRTLNGLDKAFAWRPGSAARALAGGEPTPIDETADTEGPAAAGAAASPTSLDAYPAEADEQRRYLGNLARQAECMWPIGEKVLTQAEGRGFPDQQVAVLAVAFADLSVDLADGLFVAIDKSPEFGEFRRLFAPAYGEAMLAFRRFVDYHDRLVPAAEALKANRSFMEGVSTLGHFSGEPEPYFRWSDADLPDEVPPPTSEPLGDSTRGRLVNPTDDPQFGVQWPGEERAAARVAPPGYKPGQSEHGAAGADDNQDLGEE